MKEREKLYCQYVGNAIRVIREEKSGKSGLMFSYENDIPKSTMSRIERGENEAQLVTLKKLPRDSGGLWQNCFSYRGKMPRDFKIFDDEHY